MTEGATPLPARIALVRDGEPVHLGTLDLYGQRQGATACVLAPGVLGTWDGIITATGSATIPVGEGPCAIPRGTYQLWVWHGLEYELSVTDLVLGPDDVTKTVQLRRAWAPPPTTVAADLHVHAAASNDSGMPNTQRVAAQLAAGIRVIGLSNHNISGDANAAIRELGLGAAIASIPSNEITSEMMHVGIYPAHAAPEPEQIIKADPKALFALLRALPDHPIIQVNHPRFRYQSLFDTTHWDGTSWPPPFPLDFDAMEVVAGYLANNTAGDRRLDDQLRDFYTFYQHGKAIAATAGSDTHDFNWVLDGTARVYVTLPGPYDEAAFVQAIRDRRTMATSGPWLAVTVDGAGPGQLIHATGTVKLAITVAHAAFVKPTRLRITVGDKTEELALPVASPVTIEKTVDVGSTDTFIGVAVDGDEALPLPITGTYQRDKWKKAGVTPFAVISPILVDANGDGAWRY